MNFPTELLRSINAGTAIALIGSGPSSEMGYPSWENLATTISAKLIDDNVATDPTAYQQCLDNKRYPELFKQIEYDCGGRKHLLELLRVLLKPRRPSGRSYEILSRWPFPFYLTTNYDDELYRHLDRQGVHFAVLQNRTEDLQQIRVGASHMLFKLHGDLNNPQQAVITSSDYKRLTTDHEGHYFRAKLRSLFDLWDVVIIGHSFSDPDLRLILQSAQQTADLSRPAYMIATGVSKIDVREYFQNYNIVIVPYENPDGTHAQLRALLSSADKFIPSRDTRIDLPPPIGTQDSEAASSMLIFRRLRAVQDNPGWHTAEYVAPLILQALTNTTAICTTEDFLNVKPFTSMLPFGDKGELLESIASSVQELVSRKLVDSSLPLKLTDEGRALALELRTTRELERNQAYGQFSTTLRRLFPDLSELDGRQAQDLIEQCIVESFRKRGLAIANAIFGDQSVGAEELSALFAAISQAAARLAARV